MKEREANQMNAIATKFNWLTKSPPTLTGNTGITHRFDFVALEGEKHITFDIYEQLGEIEVLRTFIKKLDTGASTYIVCLSDNITEQARKLAANYGLKILQGDALDDIEKIEKEFKPLTRS